MTYPIRFLLASSVLLPFSCMTSRADENLFGWSKGSETLPKGHVDLYQLMTMRTGKAAADGSYNAYDFETEVEYGVTNELQLGLAVVQNYFTGSMLENDGEDLTRSGYRFGGVAGSGKYRFMSPYIDSYGLALNFVVGYNWHDETAGITEDHTFVAPSLIFQRNFFDNTLVTTASAGLDFGWGKKPAEEYGKEMGLESRFGATYRFTPGWFGGLEGRIRSEYPEFNPGDNEHLVIFLGPTLHYGGEKFWATLTWAYQVYGRETDDQQDSNRAFAEQVQNEIRFKIGFNF